MSKKLIITKFKIHGCMCVVTALEADGKIIELRVQPDAKAGILGNIYVGKVQKVVDHIGAAFVDIAPNTPCYYQLEDNSNRCFTSEKKDDKLRAGDELLVQVNTEAIKMKAPKVTSNLNLAGKTLVLTTGKRNLGMSSKLNIEEKKRLKNWILPNMRDDCGIVVRTNARDANKEDILKELKYLYRRLERVLLAGKTRICYSLIEAAYPEYIYFLRDINSRDLEGIITDNKEIYEKINDYLENFQKEDMDRLSYYEDSLLPLFKLYSLESVLDHALKEKVWLKSGGFLTIQQTEAFVVIDVNSGKYEGKKKASETYRKINLEAAKEIAYQLRLRNLTGIILIDFINMENKDHQEELSHVLGKYLKQDTVKAVVVDITGLQIMEVTRKKVRKSLSEQIVEAKESREENI